MTNLLPNQLTSKITFIVGPTATGKSDLAFSLSKKNACNILVADSRQVYKDLVICSGADVPASFSVQSNDELPYSFFFDGETELHGVAFLETTDQWSLGAFHHYARQVLKRTLSQKKSLIIVGGTGLYTHSLLLPAEHIISSPSTNLRTELQTLSLTELQSRVLTIDPQSESKFNNSDWNNPRRLIRAIEILSESPSPKIDINMLKNEINLGDETIIPQWFGLTIEKEDLEQKIRARVVKRIEQGAIDEVERLASSVDDKKLSIFSTTGVKEILGYINGMYEKEELVELWSRREFQYAKRQITWFKKREYIHWVSTEKSI